MKMNDRIRRPTERPARITRHCQSPTLKLMGPTGSIWGCCSTCHWLWLKVAVWLLANAFRIVIVWLLVSDLMIMVELYYLLSNSFRTKASRPYLIGDMY